MIFASPIFLFLFLPACLLGYFLIPARLHSWRNGFLLLASLLFYAWGEPVLVLCMLFSILLNYCCALPLARYTRKHRKLALFTALVGNLGMLFVFKYLSWTLDLLGLGGHFPDILLPVGISFFTFQALSYVLDVYRGDVPAQSSLLDLALYIALFPQLIAGPIVRYKDVALQLAERQETMAGFSAGARRFCIGLAKKVLLADALGRVADAAFSAQSPGAAAGWLGAVCFALQLYFDFSGYSCMAIGLGRMFGFRFPENFQYPYVSRSMREFWRRWHISLSQWFRDYVYIPLGGSQKGLPRTLCNVLLVFLLTGLWHGASWNFVVFGLISGVCIALEDLLRARNGRGRKPLPVLSNLYVLLVWLVSCVFFRADTFSGALHYLDALAGAGGVLQLAPYLTPRFFITLALAVLGCTSLPALFGQRLQARCEKLAPWLGELLPWAFCLVLLLLSVSELAAVSYHPFLYFRF